MSLGSNFVTYLAIRADASDTVANDRDGLRRWPLVIDGDDGSVQKDEIHGHQQAILSGECSQTADSPLLIGFKTVIWTAGIRFRGTGFSGEMAIGLGRRPTPVGIPRLRRARY